MNLLLRASIYSLAALIMFSGVIVPSGIAVAAEPQSIASELSPIDVSGFRSGIHHWRNLRDESRFIQVQPGQLSYPVSDVHAIAENIVLFQRANGGWPKDYDMLAVLTNEQRESVKATRDREDTSYDNGNLHSQIDYLARAYSQAGITEWRDACQRGIDFMLQSQYPGGGFPQRFPKPHSYHAHVTFNDGVMIGILDVLQDIIDHKPHFEWLDDQRRNAATQTVQRGVQCILNCQIEVAGVKTGWCQQHDRETYQAVPARTFELASLCPQDTTQIVQFLMRQNDPSPEIIQAISSAKTWLLKVQLNGVRVERIDAEKVRFKVHTTGFDKQVVSDPAAQPIWARHYEIGSDRPIFAGRDAIKKYALAEIERERRTGTPWYGTWPERLLRPERP